MFSASVVIAVLLSTHGEEPTREEKFRGALVQAPEEVRGTTSPAFVTPQHELDFLRKNRPDFAGGEALIAIGGVASAIGVFFAILAFAVPSEGSVFALMIGGAVFGLGALLGSIGGIVMAVVGAKLTRIDARIRVLEDQRPQPQPMNGGFAIPPRVVLARF